jgi:hypothetical protein
MTTWCLDIPVKSFMVTFHTTRWYRCRTFRLVWFGADVPMETDTFHVVLVDIGTTLAVIRG